MLIWPGDKPADRSIRVINKVMTTTNADLNNVQVIYRVFFLTGPPLKMSLDWPPPKNALTGPPHFEKVLSMAAEKGEISDTLTFFIPRGASLGL